MGLGYRRHLSYLGEAAAGASDNAEMNQNTAKLPGGIPAGEAAKAESGSSIFGSLFLTAYASNCTKDYGYDKDKMDKAEFWIGILENIALDGTAAMADGAAVKEIAGRAGFWISVIVAAWDAWHILDTSKFNRPSLRLLELYARFNMLYINLVPVLGTSINTALNAYMEKMAEIHNSKEFGPTVFDDIADDIASWLENNVMRLPPARDGCLDVKKPNIYLYADEETRVSVVFERPELVTISIPDYGTGWDVLVQNGGLLKDERTDGEADWDVSAQSGDVLKDECTDYGITDYGNYSGADSEKANYGKADYGFLFYESIAYASDFQTEEGFFLGTENREAQMRMILDLYGFNETEKDDFAAYWNETLDPQQSYAMYPQNTACVDRVMPLSVTPKPDHILRLWFGFEQTKTAPSLPAETEQIERGALTLVEWGGFLLSRSGEVVDLQ
jgi:hypothetical protein